MTTPGSAQQAARFERLHQQELEPWSFSERAIEVLRHEWVARTVASFSPHRVLDVGCSLGQLTDRLARLPCEVVAVDVSPTAVLRARSRVRGRCAFAVASALSLPVASASVDFAIASDGIYSWNLDDADRRAALRELRRVVSPTGVVLLTEHTRPKRFDSFVGEIEDAGLSPINVSYFHDRPWYQVESWFRAVQTWPISRAARRNVTLARALRAVGSLGGRAASRHICVLARATRNA